MEDSLWVDMQVNLLIRYLQHPVTEQGRSSLSKYDFMCPNIESTSASSGCELHVHHRPVTGRFCRLHGPNLHVARGGRFHGDGRCSWGVGRHLVGAAIIILFTWWPQSLGEELGKRVKRIPKM